MNITSLSINAITVFLLLMLSACGSQQSKQESLDSLFTHVDSTQYFANFKGSISMRATFENTQTSDMTEGYKFQFRSITDESDFLSSISIVAGGKRIFLEKNQIILPKKGKTLTLSLDDSKFIASYPSALIQFKHNNTSYIYAIELHQIKAFSPR